ncbi:protein FAR1-RELATED SEQUENCE 9-like isoform X1 [Coffea arabica]|uniref:Protein FAR1-RELATED SEQUENCE n=2 Tax=Coffea arabica TaxID=13443 RepID=A0A6P6V467_COFAR|nr:protein FAR1-RELATED SEQUENCE 9-like [Coffea arabica]XP_027097804.1 protein FAR1-RELATED SEQUENCE 9-like [Coffea arabica]
MASPRNIGQNYKTLGGGGGGQYVLDYLKRMQAEKPCFFYAIQGVDDLSNANANNVNVNNVFWADAASKANYIYFGDAVRLDTSYRSKRYRLPLATFTGLNHHAQPVLFGCALLFNESQSSFIWLLQNWVRAMSGHHPVSITTDLDPLIKMAVEHVLPNVRHRFCSWSIFKETQEKLASVCQTKTKTKTNPAFEFEMEFKKCINEVETIEEFESCWLSLLDRCALTDNEWLQSLYNARHHWVHVYMRDTFFGDLSMAEASSPVNSFFDGFVNASTTIQSLIKQCDKAITSWHEKELKADLDTINITPVLKTPSPMEKQAANLYTRRIFMKFQGELVETLANPATKIDDSGTVAAYRVAKFGEEHKAHIVSINELEMKANCSCQMFEFSGIICRHILSVFRAKNVLTLPSQYILKRWTRDAKSGVGGVGDEIIPEFSSDSQESLTSRYNNLRQEAIKFVEEGAKSIYIYNVAMNALQEARKKVATAKKKKFDATQGSLEANGCNHEIHAGEDNQSKTCTHLSLVEKEKKIRELTAELQSTNQRCEVYRANLLAVLRDMEDQKLKLSVKVQNARLSLKE